MLKKFKCISALFLVIILFAGCAQKETPYISNEYVLEYENDKCYMSFIGERKVEEKDLSECIFFGLTFTSLDELKDTIINEKFTDGQLNVIRRDFTNKDTKKIQICNPNKLYQAVYPEKYEATMLVWEGLTYGWVFDDKEISSMSYITKDAFDRFYKQYITGCGELSTVTKTEKIEDRDSTVTYYTTTEGEFKQVCYEVEQGEKTLHVAEVYYLKGYSEYIKNNISLDVPNRITILGEQKNEYFRVFLSKLEQRPSEEYLLEFGLREFDI